MKKIVQQTEIPHLWMVIVDGNVINAFQTEAEAIDFDVNEYDFTDLIIYPLIKSNVNNFKQIAQIDFTLLGLVTETPKYGLKGIKMFSDYTFKNKLGVRKTFNYLEDGIEIIFDYYLQDDSIGFTKTEIKPLDKVELGKILKANRDRTITYLQVSAVGTPIENFVNALLKRYKTEVDLFIYNNTKDFENVIKNETVTPFLNYLNIVVAAPNFTVKDSILKQIV